MDNEALDPGSNPNLGRTLADAATVMIWVSNVNKACVYFNAAWLAFRGRSLAEEYGAGWTKGIHPEDYDRCLKIYDSAFDAREPFSMDYRLQCHDGSYRWIRDQGAPYLEPGQGFMGFVGSCFDITELVASRQALEETDERFQLLVNGINEAFWIRHVDAARQRYLSPGFEKIWGISLTELYRRPSQLWEAIHPEDQQHYRNLIRNYHQQAKAYECHYRIMTRDGHLKWIAERGYPIPTSADQPLCMAGVCTDITKQRQLEDRLLINEAGKLAQVGGLQIQLASQEMIWTTETYRLFNLNEHEEITLETLFSKIARSHRAAVRQQIFNALRSMKAVSFEFPIDCAPDPLRWVRLTGEFIEREHEKFYFYAAVQDITRQKHSDQQLRDKEAHMKYLAHHDALTAMPNRLFFYNHLNHCVARCTQHHRALAVVLIDLDRFKVINDTLGHRIGDAFLKVMGQRLTSSLGASSLAARIGGDEFAMIVEDVGSINALVVQVRKLLQSIALPITIEKHDLSSTASIGVSLFPTDGDAPDILFKAADIALFHAKNKGKNTYALYRSSVAEETAELLSLEADLARALEQKEFFVEYQPQFDLVTGRIIGAEALVRWRHARKGLIMPDVFIPIAETSGLILALGRWVLSESLRQFKAWHESGVVLNKISVNLSARQFSQPDLPSVIQAELLHYGVAPTALELEITESLMMSDLEVTLKHLQALKALGVQLSIDDFGTGYSSLSYLKRFSIDKLKIDKSFVRDIETDPNDAAISASIIALAHKMNLKVTAEGVENQQQVDFLRHHRCDEVQGFLYGRPLSHAQMASRLSEQMALA